MKKRLIIILLIAIMLLTSIMRIATAPVQAQNTNMELSIYERFINKGTYDNLGSMSIWKYKDEYKEVLLNSFNRTEPLKSIIVD